MKMYLMTMIHRYELKTHFITLFTRIGLTSLKNFISFLYILHTIKKDPFWPPPQFIHTHIHIHDWSSQPLSQDYETTFNSKHEWREQQFYSRLRTTGFWDTNLFTFSILTRNLPRGHAEEIIVHISFYWRLGILNVASYLISLHTTYYTTAGSLPQCK